MANRAYLYSLDSDDYNNPANWMRPSRNDIPYYDSRWNIPYAWFFLFRPSDVKMIDVVSDKSHWQEIRFFAQKARTLETFAERKPLLLKIATSPFGSEAILNDFVETIVQRSGKCLLMDPSEVFDGFIPETDEENFAHCKHILKQIEVEDASAEDVKSAIGYYSNFDAKDETSFRMNAIGATYA